MNGSCFLLFVSRRVTKHFADCRSLLGVTVKSLVHHRPLRPPFDLTVNYRLSSRCRSTLQSNECLFDLSNVDVSRIKIQIDGGIG